MTAVTLLDGGLGQEISKRSGKSAHALWSVKVMMEQPAIVEDVHRAFLDAGADALTVNSYTTTPSRLARNGFPEWFDDAQQLALRLVNNARDQADRPVQVTGCLPPLVATYVTEESKPYEGSLEEYRKICAHQGEQVDVMFIETIGIIAEAMAAIDAAKETGKPVYLGYTISDDGSNTLRSGERLEDAAEAADLQDQEEAHVQRAQQHLHLLVLTGVVGWRTQRSAGHHGLIERLLRRSHLHGHV